MTRLLLLTLTFLVLAAPALAATNYNDVEDEVMCVSCNLPLGAAESPQAEQERGMIRDLVAQGKSKQEIKEALVTEYGPRVLAMPDDNGFGIAVYLVPIAVVLALIGLVAILLPKWRGRGEGPGGPPPAPAISPADSARLTAELDKFDP